MAPTGSTLRFRRLRGVGGRIFLAALDHGLPAGPLPGIEGPGDFLHRLRGGPVTGAILNPGIAACLASQATWLPALVIHLSAGTLLATEPASKVLSATVESAAARGADAVSVQIHFGTRMEGRMVADAGTVVDEASAFGLPVLAMAYGPSAPGSPSSDAEATRHAVRAATELGVSLVQTSFAGDSEDLRSVVRACPVPLLFAGGPRASSPDAWLASIRDAMDAGAAGITAGRNLFQAADPAAFANQIGEAIFGAHPLQGVGGEG